MSATILQFPVARTKRAVEQHTLEREIQNVSCRKVRHAQQGAQIDAFAERMEALEDLFRGCE